MGWFDDNDKFDVTRKSKQIANAFKKKADGSWMYGGSAHGTRKK